MSRPEDQPGWAWPAPSTGGDATRGPTGAPTSPSEGWTVPSPEAAAGAPRKRRGHGWLVLLLVVIGLIVTMGIAGTILFVDRTLPPYRAANDFVGNVMHDQPAAAAHNLCSADAASPEATIRRVRRIVSRHGTFHTMSVNPLGVDRTGDEAKVDFTVSYEHGVSSQTYSLAVIKEDGDWKACP